MAKDNKSFEVKLEFDSKGAIKKIGNVKTQFKQMGDSAKKSGKGISKSMLKTGVAVAGVAIVAKKMADGLKFATKVGMEFEKSMSQVKAISGATADEFKQLEGDAKRLGASTAFTATQVAQLQTEYSKLGFNTKEILNATEATLNLAAATGSDLATSAAVAGATVKGFGLEADETARVTDVMALSFSSSALDMSKFTESMKTVAPIASASGIAIEDTTAILGVLSNVGIAGSVAGTGLKNMFIKLADESGPLYTKLNDLVTANKDLLPAFDGTFDSTEELAPVFEKLKEEGLSLGDAVDYVGKISAPAFLALVNNSESLQPLTDKLDNATGSAKEMSDIMLDNMAGSITIMESSLEGLGIAIFDKFIKPMRPAIDLVTEFSSALTGMIAPSQIDLLIDEQTEINGLVTAIQLAGDKTKVRKDLMDKMQTLYPSFLENLNGEKTTNEQLRDRLQEVNTEFAEKIRLAAQQEVVKELNEETAESYKKVLNSTIGFGNVMAKSVTRLNGILDENGLKQRFVLDATMSSGEQMEAFSKAVGETNTLVNQGNGYFDKNVDVIGDMSANLGLLKTEQENVKTATEDYNEIAQENGEKVAFANQEIERSNKNLEKNSSELDKNSSALDGNSGSLDGVDGSSGNLNDTLTKLLLPTYEEFKKAQEDDAKAKANIEAHTRRLIKETIEQSDALEGMVERTQKAGETDAEYMARIEESTGKLGVRKRLLQELIDKYPALKTQIEGFVEATDDSDKKTLEWGENHTLALKGAQTAMNAYGDYYTSQLDRQADSDKKFFDNQREKKNKAHDEDVERMEARVEKGEITQEEFNEWLKGSEEALAEDLKKIKETEHKRDIARQIKALKASRIQAIANAAVAIVLGFAQLGPVGGAIAAVATGIATAFQIKTINTQISDMQQEYNALNKGGFAINKLKKMGGNIPDHLGSGTKDDVPAILTAGEFVIKRDSAKRIGKEGLERLNRTGQIGLHDGGSVPPIVTEHAHSGSDYIDWTHPFVGANTAQHHNSRWATTNNSSTSSEFIDAENTPPENSAFADGLGGYSAEINKRRRAVINSRKNKGMTPLSAILKNTYHDSGSLRVLEGSFRDKIYTDWEHANEMYGGTSIIAKRYARTRPDALAKLSGKSVRSHYMGNQERVEGVSDKIFQQITREGPLSTVLGYDMSPFKDGNTPLRSFSDGGWVPTQPLKSGAYKDWERYGFLTDWEKTQFDMNANSWVSLMDGIGKRGDFFWRQLTSAKDVFDSALQYDNIDGRNRTIGKLRQAGSLDAIYVDAKDLTKDMFKVGPKYGKYAPPHRALLLAENRRKRGLDNATFKLSPAWLTAFSKYKTSELDNVQLHLNDRHYKFLSNMMNMSELPSEYQHKYNWNRFTAYEKGGLITKPTMALMGEGRQNELVVPENDFKDWIDSKFGTGIAPPKQDIINIGTVLTTKEFYEDELMPIIDEQERKNTGRTL